MAKSEEPELRALETQALGPTHAAEHAAARSTERRAAAEWRRLTPADRAALIAAEESDANQRALGPADEVGRWTTAPFPIPTYAIHSAVLPTGKVLFWGYPPFEGGVRANDGEAALWDPSKGTGPDSMREIPPPQIDVDGDGDLEAAPIYCSGQSFLPSGALLVTGGNLVWASTEGDEYEDFAGHNRAFTFDPWSETWIEQPAMSKGRWYPTQVEMADGRTLMVSGYDETPPGSVYNPELEIFTPSPSPTGIGTMQRLPSGDRQTSIYPHLFTVKGGDVALAGANKYESALLSDDDFTWTDFSPAARHRDAGAAVLVPDGPEGSSTVAQIGGFDLSDNPDPGDGSVHATATSEQIDFGAGTPGWTPGASMELGRANHNTVLLPDASMATIGGGRGYHPNLGSYVTHNDGRLRQMEIYDPEAGDWRLGPAQEEDRAYHSTAVLLPDGRVMSAGDDLHPTLPGGGFSESDTAEIYSPLYLYRGARPVISAAPAAVEWGERFAVGSNSPNLERAVLMAPDATTHGVDMQQRHVELAVQPRASGGFDAVAPADGSVAPPGPYMLFLLNDRGVPSVASWVRVAAPPPPTPDPPDTRGAGPSVSISFTRTAKGGRKGGVLARVETEGAARVTLALTVKGSRGKVLARKRGTVVLDRAGVRHLLIRVKPRKLREARRVVTSVAARDGNGATSDWLRTLPVAR